MFNVLISLFVVRDRLFCMNHTVQAVQCTKSKTLLFRGKIFVKKPVKHVGTGFHGQDVRNLEPEMIALSANSVLVHKIQFVAIALFVSLGLCQQVQRQKPTGKRV